MVKKKFEAIDREKVEATTRIKNFLQVHCEKTHTASEIAQICPEYTPQKVTALLHYMEQEKLIDSLTIDGYRCYTLSKNAIIENFKRACTALNSVYPGIEIRVHYDGKLDF